MKNLTVASITIFICFVLIIGGLFIFFEDEKTQQPFEISLNGAQVTLAGKTFNVALAITPQERMQGLSNTEPLGENEGLLFIFPEVALHSFWMKDMRYPLDIIWIYDDRVVDIWESAPTPTVDYIPTYTPVTEAEYVLEVNAGFVANSGLKAGDEAIIDIN